MAVQQKAALMQHPGDQSEPAQFWPLVRLGDYCAVQNGYPFKSDYFNEESGVPLIRVRSLKTQNCDIRYSDSYDSAYLVHDGDVLIGMDGDFQPCLWSGGEALLNQRVCRLVKFSSELDPYYAYQALKEPLNLVEQTTHFTTVKHLSAFTIQDIRIPLPPLSEQHAIARALRAVQDAIQARRREVELEREHKAALMQRLFTYGTRGEPTKQTEIGEMPESWQVAQLGDVCGFHGGTQPPRNTFQFLPTEGYVRLLQIRDFESDDYATYVSTKYNLRLVDDEDVLIARYGASVGRILTGKSGAINVAIMMTLPDQTKLIKPFLCYLLQTSRIQAYITSLGGRSAQAGFNQGELARIAAPLPSLSEQWDIANTLKQAEKTISALEREIALHEELFRALLEELMTGRLSALPLVEATDDAEGSA